MKVKSWIKYLIYMCLILIVVFVGQYVFKVYRQYVESTFNFNPYYQTILMTTFYSSLGLLLGLDHLICEIRKNGAWVVNLPKIVLMGIPSLYFSLSYIIYYTFTNFLSSPIGVLLLGGGNFTNAFSIIFGYSIITSFYKATKNDII